MAFQTQLQECRCDLDAIIVYHVHGSHGLIIISQGYFTSMYMAFEIQCAENVIKRLKYRLVSC